MKPLAFLFVLCLAVGACAQPFILGSDPVFAPITPASGTFYPTNIAGMAYFWNYNDYTKGASLSSSNWLDEVQSHAITNTAGPVTNTSDGMWYSSVGVSAIAPAVTVTGTFSIWICVTTGLTNPSSYSGLLSDSTYTSGLFNMSGATPSVNFYSGADHTICYIPYDSTNFSLVYANGTTWTNGVQASVITPPASQVLCRTGRGGAYIFYSGLKFIGVWTNKALTISDAASLTTYGNTH